jgi:MoaA/NifB/PqqE/SkfB family radical SAM enzyme
MDILNDSLQLIPKFVGYKLSRLGIVKPPMPMTLTFSVTNSCQSRCKTCNIWQIYIKNPELKKKELKIEEIEKVFKSIGPVYFFNISGGEPFLRKDLPQIVELACKYLKPKIIHSPTNGLLPKIIEEKMREIMKILEKYGNTHFTIKPSFDGIGKKQDIVRGIPGHFVKTLDTIERLKKVQKDYKNLYVGLGTVISNFNLNDIKETSNYVHKLNVDTYINEIAEQRSELLTLNSPITPTGTEYKKIIRFFSNNIKTEMKKKKKKLNCVTQAFRLVYYDLVVKTLKQKKQVIPCYGGLSNAHLNAYGDVWPCCILGYRKSMGNVRDANYNFRKIWRSKKANKIRKFIKDKKCYCPLANQYYSNIYLNVRSMFKVLFHMFK